MSLPQVCKLRTSYGARESFSNGYKKKEMSYTEETTCAVATILRLRNFGVNQVYKSQISIVKRYQSRRFER